MRGRPVVLALIDLIQDLDVLLPLLEGIRRAPDLALRIRVSRWLLEASPRTARTLRQRGLAYRTVRRSAVVVGRAPTLFGVRAVLTASDSAAAAHRGAHALARRARAAGLATYTLQHGVEFSRPGEPPAAIASETVFCWGPYGFAAARGTGAAPVIAGRSAAFEPVTPAHAVGVFENLHWNRYTDDDRAIFVDRLTGLAQARPALGLLVRAHPAGGWLDLHAPRLATHPNIIFQPSAEARASTVSGGAVAAACLRVIATPSTVLLDAAMAGRAVALAGDGGPAYAGLPMLTDAASWAAFADGPAEPGPAQTRFVERHVAPGCAVESIVARLASDLSPPKPLCEKRG